MTTPAERLKEALRQATIRFSRNHGEPEPSVAFPIEAVFTIPQWNAVQAALNSLPAPAPPADESGDLRLPTLLRDNESYRAKLTAIVVWLEANQPDVFRRGLWDAINAADAPSPAGHGAGEKGTKVETGWLIETTSLPVYLRVADWHGFDWTTDSLKAIRFSRREDAEQVLLMLESVDAKAAEHQWG